MSRHCCRDPTTYPPASDEQPLSPVYMVFQPIRCTAPDVATRTGELLPHLFTLVHRSFSGGGPQLTSDGYFLLHYYTLADIFPLGSMVLCVARTFLSRRLRSGHDGTACCAAKILKNHTIIKINTFADQEEVSKVLSNRKVRRVDAKNAKLEYWNISLCALSEKSLRPLRLMDLIFDTPPEGVKT